MRRLTLGNSGLASGLSTVMLASSLSSGDNSDDPPGGSNFNILTEGGDNLVTEGGDAIVTEDAP